MGSTQLTTRATRAAFSARASALFCFSAAAAASVAAAALACSAAVTRAVASATAPTPTGGFKAKLLHYNEGGDAGNRGEKIHELVKKML